MNSFLFFLDGGGGKICGHMEMLRVVNVTCTITNICLTKFIQLVTHNYLGCLDYVFRALYIFPILDLYKLQVDIKQGLSFTGI